jgi:uncharacterized integral membrane protein
MNREEKRREEREQLVRSMARKLATGNGIEIIAAARKRKRSRIVIYTTSGILLFLIVAVILYLITPDQVTFNLDFNKSEKPEINLLQLLSKDLTEKKITFNQYVFYLRDILVRYDSLPKQYRPAMPDVKTQSVYDSLCAVWKKVDLQKRQQLLKELPKLEFYLKEYQFKISSRTE